MFNKKKIVYVTLVNSEVNSKGQSKDLYGYKIQIHGTLYEGDPSYEIADKWNNYEVILSDGSEPKSHLLTFLADLSFIPVSENLFYKKYKN